MTTIRAISSFCIFLFAASVYAAPAAHYAAEGNADDATGNGNDGQSFNGVLYEPGVSGSAFSFDGVDDFVELNVNPGLGNAANALTVEAWIYPKQLPVGTTQFIVSADDGGSFEAYSLFSLQLTSVPPNVTYLGPVIGMNAIFGVRAQGQTEVHAAIAMSDASYWAAYWHGLAIANNHPAIVADQWIHLVGVYTGSETRLYINGALAASSVMQPDGSDRSVSGPLVNTTNPRRIGRPAYDGIATYGSFAGLVDEVKIYPYALTDAEVQDEFSGGSPGSCETELIAANDQILALQAALDAANQQISEKTNEITMLNTDIVAQQSMIDGLQIEVADLQASIAALTAEINTLGNENVSLAGTVAIQQQGLSEAASALLEIQGLIATPPGRRSSSSDYTGPLGDQLNGIVDMLLAPPGQNKRKGN